MAVLLLNPYQQFFDENGDPLSGGKVYTYQAGTTTPKATYTDNTEVTQADNPVILDAAGRATLWGSGAYKFMVYDFNNVLIRTTDNVSTYITSDLTGNSYFESFSGTGSQTAFTTSSDLGTDEKAIMVFVAQGLQQHVTNGDFTSDTAWTKGAGWTIAAGVATATGAISTALTQNSAVTLVAGQSYNLIYTVTRSAGGIIPSIGGTNGTERTASGTYRETIIAGSTQTLAFTGNAFTGTIDAISITPSDMKGYDIQSPSNYTINGTSLTFATAPAAGTGNIYVFAPSLLVAQANSAAAAADASASSANASAILAATSAGQAALASKWKPSVLVATTANITLSGEQTIDTQLTSSSRVLVKNQTIASQNGVYVSAAGAWSRATDADTASELLQQSVTVTAGSVNIRKSFSNTNEAGFILGTDPVTFTEILVYPVQGSVVDSSLAAGAVILSSSKVTGTLGVANGGTGRATLTSNSLLAGNGTGTVNLIAPSTSGNVLTSNGTSWVSSPPTGITSGTAQASTSGTAIDFTGIPSTATQVTILLYGVSTNGTSNLLIQVGNGSFVTTGYAGSAMNTSGSGLNTINATNGLQLQASMDAPTGVVYGQIVATKITGNTWILSANWGRSDAALTGISSAGIALAGALDRVRVTSVSGDTFDAGTINIIYE